MRAWSASRTFNRPYSEIAGLQGLEAYALDMAVLRWGTAFQSAIDQAANGAKNQNEANSKVQTVIRRWVPSTRRYR